MKLFTGPMSKQTKSIMLAAGLLLMLPGMIIALANLCIFPFAILSSQREAHQKWDWQILSFALQFHQG